MNTRCTVCNHPCRRDLEEAHLAGETLRGLAKRFDRAKSTVQRHLKEHTPGHAQKAIEAADARNVEAGDSIIAKVETLYDEARRLQREAEKKKDWRTAITAIRELVRIVELQARLVGELRDREINITNVQIDTETASRMAQMFLARQRRPAIAAPVIEVSAGIAPVAASEVIENEEPK